MHRWQDFMVDTQTGEILVEDIVDSSMKSLRQWRNQDKPMERTEGAHRNRPVPAESG